MFYNHSILILYLSSVAIISLIQIDANDITRSLRQKIYNGFILLSLRCCVILLLKIENVNIT